MSDSLADALAYAAQGLHVHPFHNLRKDSSCTCDKADCGSPGKHPWSKNGKDDATASPAAIRALFKGKPTAQVGVNCGASGVVVLDVDVRKDKDGHEAWAALVAEHGAALDAAPTAETPHHGFHALFRMDGNRIGCPGPPKGSPDAGPLGVGIDVKGIGGSVILPSANSPARDWIPGHELGAVSIPELPPALAERLAYTARCPGRRRAAGEAGKASKVAEGGRNAHLTSRAGSMRRDGFSEAAILAALQQENAEHCDPPLAEREVEKIAASVGKYPPKTPAAEAGAPEAQLREDRTDAGNANVFVRLMGDRVRYVAAWGAWAVFDGKRWMRDATHLVESLVGEALLTRFDEAAQAPDLETSKKLAAWAASSRSAAKQAAALQLARSDRRIAARPEDFDRDDFAFNCLNGALDLRIGKLRPHDPADLITKLAPVVYDPDARSDLWERVLAEATGADDDVQTMLQRFAGSALTGDCRDEKAFMFYGPTASMKTTVLAALGATWGDYGVAADPEAFLARAHVGGPRDDIAAMEGARLVVVAEFDRGRKMAEALLKQLTGGDRIRARHLYQAAREFRFTAKIAMHANDIPRLSDDDDAVWRRFVVIHFAHTIPADKRDPTVKARLCDPAESGAAILAWAVRGCRDWQADGLGEPPAVTQATQAVRLSMDPLADFFAERVEFEPGVWTASGLLRGSYDQWAAMYKRRLLSPKEWGVRLSARGLEPNKRNGVRGWLGVRLADAEFVEQTFDSEPTGSVPGSDNGHF